MTEPTPIQRKPTCTCGQCQQQDGTRRLALIIRRGLLVIVRGIEAEFGASEDKKVA